MKNPVIIGAVMLALGITIGWVVKPGAEAEKPSPGAVSTGKSATVNPAPELSDASSPKGKRAIRPVEEEKNTPNVPNEKFMDEAKEMQTEMTKRMIDRQRQKFEQQIERLAESLSLTAEQKSMLTAWLDASLEELEGADFTDPKFTEKLGELSGLLTQENLQAQLGESLSPDQQIALTEYQERDRAGKIDTLALKGLSNLQGIIQFEEGQRDKVYQLLSESAAETLDSQSATPDLGSMLTEGMGIEMDPYDLGIQQAMTEAMGDLGSLNDDSKIQQGMVKNLRQIVNDRIDAKVEKLRPALNDRQLETYRNELQTKGLGVYGSVFDAMEKMEEGGE